MPNGFSELDFLLAPDEAQARALVEARRRALARRAPAAGVLALTPEPRVSRMGQAMLSEEQEFGPRAAQLLAQRRAEERAGRQETRAEAQLGLSRAAMAQGRWTPVVKVDPQTGRTIALLVDTRTGEVRPLPLGERGGPAAAPEARPGTLPRAKMTETQLKTAGAAGGVATAMRTALRVGFPEPGLRGLPQAAGQYLSRRGLPALASPAAEQTYAAWYNVVRPLVNIRTGQQMAVQELEREFAALAPRPGEAPQTQLMKVRQMVPLMRYYTAGLPPAVADALNAEYDEVEAALPQSVEELAGMRATGGGGLAPRGPPLPRTGTSRSGRPMVYR